MQSLIARVSYCSFNLPSYSYVKFTWAVSRATSAADPLFFGATARKAQMLLALSFTTYRERFRLQELGTLAHIYHLIGSRNEYPSPRPRTELFHVSAYLRISLRKNRSNLQFLPIHTDSDASTFQSSLPRRTWCGARRKRIWSCEWRRPRLATI